MVVENDGNVHATDVVVILCIDQTQKEIRKDGCEEENVVARQVIGAIMPPNAAGTTSPATLTLLYPVRAGSHDVAVVIDPDNEIVEANERDNIELLDDELASSYGLLDVAGGFVANAWLPGLLAAMTLAMVGVLGLVGAGRRKLAKERSAEARALLDATTHVDD